MNYDAYFDTALGRIKAEDRYRIFRPLERDAQFPRVKCETREIVSWCGSDYLGMTQHSLMKQAMIVAIEQYGMGAGGTRNIGGTHTTHLALEAKLAALHQQEAGLIFTSGYVANQACLASFGEIIPDLIFFSDSENHMSMIEGIRQSRADKVIFEHNNLADLEQKLAAQPLSRPKMIAFESVYSMSGDFGPLQEIILLAKRYNALTYVDEVHAVGALGATGGGLSQVLGCAHELDIIQGTLGKGFGLLGGYITAKRNIVDAIRSVGKGFIFTTSLPPHISGAGLAVLEYLETHHTEQQALAKITAHLKQGLQAAKLPLLPSPSQIIPIFVGDAKRCQALAEALFNEEGIYIQAVNYPTVRKGEERLRISPTALHTLEQADALIEALRRHLAATLLSV